MISPRAMLLLHERWFVSDAGMSTRWSHALDPATLVTVGAALLVVLPAILLWRQMGQTPFVPGPLALGATTDQLQVVYGWLPLLLAVHTAIPLLVSGVQNHLLVPNLVMERGTGVLVGLAEVAVGLLLFYGLFSRYAALGLVGIWMVGVILFGPVLLLEQTIYLGIAAFFWIAGRGPIAIDRMFGEWARPRREWLPHAVSALRVATGFSIVWLALTEKLLNLPLALAFLDAYPFANFLPALGLAVSDATFVRIAGGIELTAGLLLMVGAFPRLTILLLWLPFNLTLTAFGWRELVGHLPIYATIGAVLLWGRGGPEDIRAFESGLMPRRTAPIDPETQ